eukprot:Nk52_evm5s294 gene=Nk52_evmTU5s294
MVTILSNVPQTNAFSTDFSESAVLKILTHQLKAYSHRRTILQTCMNVSRKLNELKTAIVNGNVTDIHEKLRALYELVDPDQEEEEEGDNTEYCLHIVFSRLLEQALFPDEIKAGLERKIYLLVMQRRAARFNGGRPRSRHSVRLLQLIMDNSVIIIML